MTNSRLVFDHNNSFVQTSDIWARNKETIQKLATLGTYFKADGDVDTIGLEKFVDEINHKGLVSDLKIIAGPTKSVITDEVFEIIIGAIKPENIKKAEEANPTLKKELQKLAKAFLMVPIVGILEKHQWVGTRSGSAELFIDILKEAAKFSRQLDGTSDEAGEAIFSFLEASLDLAWPEVLANKKVDMPKLVKKVVKQLPAIEMSVVPPTETTDINVVTDVESRDIPATQSPQETVVTGAAQSVAELAMKKAALEALLADTNAELAAMQTAATQPAPQPATEPEPAPVATPVAETDWAAASGDPAQPEAAAEVRVEEPSSVNLTEATNRLNQHHRREQRRNRR